MGRRGRCMRQWRVAELLRSVKNIADLKTALQIIAESCYDVRRGRFHDGTEAYTIERRGRELFWIYVGGGKIEIYDRCGLISEVSA